MHQPGPTPVRTALKYCGGCDPGFDRVACFEKIRDAAGNSIRWLTLEDPDIEAVLVICGCDIACPEKDLDFSAYRRVISIRSDVPEPGSIVETLLERGTK